MRRRLLLFFPGVERGGCEEYALAAAVEARARGYDAEVCFPQLERTRSLRADFERAAVPVHAWEPRAACGTGDAFDGERRQALALLARLRPERVWLALPWVDSAVGFLAACGLTRARGLCVWQLATETVDIDPAQAAAARRSLESGMGWAAVSRQNRTFVARSYGVDESRVHVLPNGLLSDAAFAPPPRGAREALRSEVLRELGVGADARLVVTVARLCLEQKGHDILVESIKRMGDLERTYFVWAGDGEDRARIGRMVDEAGLRGCVLMLGFRTDIARLLAAADLFVLPSNLEGMPFAVYEALACGCPVVATSVGGNPEVLTHGHDALLVPARDADALARAVARALREPDLLDRLSRNGADTARGRSRRSLFSETFSLLEAAPEAEPGVARA
jgi:glycosyltransferase involved in cell wall biosynthesis